MYENSELQHRLTQAALKMNIIKEKIKIFKFCIRDI